MTAIVAVFLMILTMTTLDRLIVILMKLMREAFLEPFEKFMRASII